MLNLINSLAGDKENVEKKWNKTSSVGPRKSMKHMWLTQETKLYAGNFETPDRCEAMLIGRELYKVRGCGFHEGFMPWRIPGR